MALRGVTEPRVWTPPLRELTPDTTLGYACIEFSRDVLGIEPLPWQAWLLVHALEVVGDFDGDWRLRFRVVLVLVARQNGKTYVSMLLSLFFLYVLGVSLILGTAQDLAQAEETWEAALNAARDNWELAAEIEKVLQGKGSKELRLQGWRRYKVATPNDKNTRGKSCELVLLDELRTHQTFDAWNAASKTIKARRSAVVWCISNAGNGLSVVLRHLRMQAHKSIGDPDGIVAAAAGSEPAEPNADEMAALESMGIFEWSAPPGCDVWDRSAWAQANPSLGYGFLDESAIAIDAASDTEDGFRAEDLCQWVTTAVAPPFPAGSWEAGVDPDSIVAKDSPVAFGIDVSADRRHVSIAACGERPDHEWHVELVEYRDGLGWVMDWFARRVHRYGGRMRVALQGGAAPSASLADILAGVDGVEVTEAKGAKVGAWCSRMWDAVAALDPNADGRSEGTTGEGAGVVPVRHVAQPMLDLAAAVAVTRPMGDGAWTWSRDRSCEDVSPLVAATMAFGLATDPPEEQPKASAYDDHDLMFL